MYESVCILAAPIKWDDYYKLFTDESSHKLYNILDNRRCNVIGEKSEFPLAWAEYFEAAVTTLAANIALSKQIWFYKAIAYHYL